MRCIAVEEEYLSEYYNNTVVDYLKGKGELKEFYQYASNTAGYQQKIQERNFSQQQREVLVNTLSKQYNSLLTAESSIQKNIDALKEGNTYTVTTGQQVHIYLGPLYVVNKILSTIAKCRELKEQYPDKNFVPVFWMASEDHDFEEINHVNLYYKEFKWQGEEGVEGAVGRLNPSSINTLEADIKEVLNKDDEAKKLLELFTEAYAKYSTLADATRYVLKVLFEEQGLVVIDADDISFKQQLKPYILSDIFADDNVNAARTATEKLEQNYKAQIFPRKINFFYLTEKGRYRIEKEEDTYKALDSDISFTEEELKTEIENHPERFSPNVVMRPLYQEVILPNIAYIGGPAEVNYWLQLKGVFDVNKVSFPIIELRKSLIIINERTVDKIKELNLTVNDFLKDIRVINEEYVEEHGTDIPDYSSHYKTIEEELDTIKQKALEVDANLKPFLEGEFKKITDTFGKLDNKLQKFEKQKFENQLKKIENIKTKFFTAGKLTERIDTVLSEPQIVDSAIIEQLLKTFKQLKSPLIIVLPPLK